MARLKGTHLSSDDTASWVVGVKRLQGNWHRFIDESHLQF